jgi:hypothetical protein
MLRRRDWFIGAFGILMLAGGAILFLRDGAGIFPLWLAWLVGPLLWYTGFLAACVWFLVRATASPRQQKEGAHKNLAKP